MKNKLCPCRIFMANDNRPRKPVGLCKFEPDNWYEPSIIDTTRFHTRAWLEMRSKPTKGGHANQCIYDGNGYLLTAYYPYDVSPGTADFSSNDLAPGEHYWNDLRPFILAGLLDGNILLTLSEGRVVKKGTCIDKYFEVRPVLPTIGRWEKRQDFMT